MKIFGLVILLSIIFLIIMFLQGFITLSSGLQGPISQKLGEPGLRVCNSIEIGEKCSQNCVEATYQERSLKFEKLPNGGYQMVVIYNFYINIIYSRVEKIFSKRFQCYQDCDSDDIDCQRKCFRSEEACQEREFGKRNNLKSDKLINYQII